MTEPTDADRERAIAIHYDWLADPYDASLTGFIAQALADERARALAPIRDYADKCRAIANDRNAGVAARSINGTVARVFDRALATAEGAPTT